MMLDEGRVLRLATAGAGGPHVVPVWYMHEGGAVYVGTGSKTAKARNIERDGRVAFCIDEGVMPPIRGLMWRGRARLIRRPESDGLARKILLRYYDSLESGAAKELLEETDCVIEIRPERAAEWEY